jgi:DMSO reductase family type II enzyme chaperone
MKDHVLALFRSRVYKILSICFLYPNEKSMLGMRKGLPGNLEGCLQRLPHAEAIKDDSDSIRTAFNELSRISLEDLEVEYTRLFIYSRPHVPCSPYESIDVEKTRRLMGDSTMAVKQMYRTFKLSVSDQFKDLPDHIGAELEFMHFLSFNEGTFAASGMKEASDVCVEGEKTFLMDHMLKWVPAFHRCLEENSKLKFFVSIAKLTNDFIAEDARYLMPGLVP